MDVPENKINDLKTRLILATADIRANRTVGQGHNDEQLLKKNGFSSFNEYWGVALSEEMSVSEFIYLLETHLTNPDQCAKEIHHQVPTIKSMIVKSLRKAWENGESWFILPQNNKFNPVTECVLTLNLRPHAAAKWFLERPMHADRLPPTLRAFFAATPIPSPVSEKKPKHRQAEARKILDTLGDYSEIGDADLARMVQDLYDKQRSKQKLAPKPLAKRTILRAANRDK